MAARLDFGLTGLALITRLPPIPVLRLRTQELVLGGFEALSGPARRLCCVKCHAAFRQEEMAPADPQEFLWQQFFADPTEWWDKRRSKGTPRHPDFMHKKSNAALWLNNRHKPAWLDSQLATWDAAMKEPTGVQVHGPFGTEAAVVDYLEVGKCRKLCEDGRITDAVEALNLRVQRGLHVDNNLFYVVLKRCIAGKDLVLGIRVHALTVKSGYEGDAFLATHLITMYASHERLEVARQVFTKVSNPDAHNWATIIFAYARHGEAAEAIRLYRQMQELTTVKPTDHVYVAVLKACAAAEDLVTGKEVHVHILANLGKLNMFVETGLVNMYVKCKSLEGARRVFDTLTVRNVVTWNVLFAGYAQQGMGQEAFNLYCRMRQEGITPPDAVSYLCLLQACARVGVGAISQGKQLHAEIQERGLQNDRVIGCSLVNMYAKCGSLVDAHRVFDRLPDKDVVTWTAMIAGYVQQGMGQEAFSLYSSMQHEALISPNSVLYICLLQACACVGIGALDHGRQLHAQIEERGLQDDVVIGSSLVNMYSKCGSLAEARKVFHKLPARLNVVTWNTMIAGYAQQGMGQEALSLYKSMQQECLTAPDSVTYVCLLQACASVGVEALVQGQQLHAQIQEQNLQDDVVVGGSLVNMYVKCSSIEDARRVFDKLPASQNVVTWNTMIAGYAQQGMAQEALSLYNRMQQEDTPPDSVTYVCLLQACASEGIGGLHQGKQLHTQIQEGGLQDDTVVGSSLVNMYAKCGSLVDARRVFDRLGDRDVVTWTAMIDGYAQKGMGPEALSLYNSMQQEGLTPPDSVAYVCLLQACAVEGVEGLHQGKQLHAQIEEQGLQDDVVIGSSLVNMYAKCGSLEDARRVFDRLRDRNVVTWTAMIGGYTQQGMGQEALVLYESMQQEGLIPPNSVSYVCLLQACGSVAALPLGKQLHTQIKQQGLEADVFVGTALVNMYAKCGSMYESLQVFNSLPERTIQAWGALIAGYTFQGDSKGVFDLLDRMKLEELQPNGIMFVSVLSVCSHVGLVDKGREYFEAMRIDYGISPTVEHYTCMMDLLGRAGHLDDALWMAKTMPFPSNSAVWHTLLGGCQKWKNVEIAEQAFESAVRIDGGDAASYVLMSSIYAGSDVGCSAGDAG